MNLVKLVFCVLSLYAAQAVGIFKFRFNLNYLRERPEGDPLIEQWMEMPVDHFNSSDKRTWRIRYFQSLSYWKPNGPIYVEIDGESESSAFFFPLTQTLAKDTNGAIFKIEHRYYGKSIPVPYTDVASLQYLSSEQALADVATFVRRLKADPKYKGAKVVAVGGSYAGNLAAWTRVVYPDVFYAASSSSAPVLAKVDFYEGLEKITNDLNKYGTPGCAKKLHNHLMYCTELLKTDDGIKKFKQIKHICEESDMKKKYNQYLFFMNQVENAWVTIQGNPLEWLKTFCKYIPGPKGLLVYEEYSSALMLQDENNKRCNDIDYDKYIQLIKRDPSWRPWFYQQCTEFGYFFPTTSPNQAFVNVPLDFFTKQCSDVFGPEFDEERLRKGVENTNSRYGGRRPNVTRVVFTNGDADPWGTLGVLSDLSPEAPARIIPDGQHCSNLMELQKFEIDTIEKWIRT